MIAASLCCLSLLIQDGRREAAAPRVPGAMLQPRIDGVLEEEAWQDALLLGPFTEVEPEEGRPADPPTEIYLMRDADFLYIGMVCHEPRPETMVLQNMRRDAFLNDDDRVEFLIDPLRDGKTAYWFQLSAAGSRGDALISDNGQRFNKPWDGFWDGATQLHADRWVGEVAIPLRNFAFDDSAEWAMNFERYRGSDRSVSRWATPRRDTRIFTVSIASPVAGFEDSGAGLGWEFVPYFKVKRVETENPEAKNTLGTGGGELSLRITPQLTGSFTANTDFAETEADERQVNLTRFPLFFPEKRDFFLQDAALFEFGEQARFGSADAQFLPFFSRRIGLAPNGTEVPIDAGARLAGRLADLDLGLLAVRAGEVRSAGVPETELFVARPAWHLTEEAAVGALITSGNPTSRAANLVTGADFRYTSTDLLPGNFAFNSYALRSSDEATHEVGAGWGAQASLQGRDWFHRVETLSSQNSFRPALGFVQRPGQRYYLGETRWEPRPGGDSAVRNYVFAFRPRWWTDLSGEVQSHGIDLTFFGAEWHNGAAFTTKLAYDGDRLDQPFSPAAGTTIRKGNHHWFVLENEFETGQTGAFAAAFALNAGGWYNGDALRAGGELVWRPGAALSLGLSLSEEHFNLPGGDFVSRIGIFSNELNFSPALSLQSLVQADNQSDLLGLQSRLRWIEEDGRELFLVVNAGWVERPLGPYVPLSRDLTAKLVYALRF